MTYDSWKLDTPPRLDGRGSPDEDDDMARELLRLNSGSYPTVERVYAYDPGRGKALVLLRYGDGECGLSEAPVAELEALDDARRYVTLDAVLRRRAGHVLERAGEPVADCELGGEG